MNAHLDPAADAAGVVGPECFLCGKRRNGGPCNGTFGIPDMPELACHLNCLHGRLITSVVREYHVRLADAVNLPRFISRRLYGLIH